MEQVKAIRNLETLTLQLLGRIDTNNAADIEAQCNTILDENKETSLTIDATNLEYISSAGLRVLLKIRKKHPHMRIVQVSSKVYEIFDMTGFTKMLPVERAYKEISIEGCEKIGEGANGEVYRIDPETVVKTYRNPDSLEEIRHEREVAREAFILGIPTAISYDIVKVNGSYGSVFELLNATSLSKLLAQSEDNLDYCVGQFVDLLKLIHETEVPEGLLPDLREEVLTWMPSLEDLLPQDIYNKMVAMITAIPQDNHMIHGDYHTKNIMMQGDEALLIDMDTLAVGHPVFEFAFMFNAFLGYNELTPEGLLDFLGFSYELAERFWKKALAQYLETDDPARIQEVTDKARVIGSLRMIRRFLRRDGLNNPDDRRYIDHWLAAMTEMIEKYDELTF
ncbi:MAG: anti-sigma factor antagonist [Eubacterium sp.]|nr:anti-sigma factor antagonist [Eubacterium sp.]